MPLSEADPLLRTASKGESEAASVACSHFNAFISASKARLSSMPPSLLPEALIDKCPAMEIIFNEGVNWTVWRYAAEDK